MSQAPLAIVALVIVMFFSLSQHEKTQHNMKDMIRDEVELMASGVALEAMEYIASHPFDAATAAPGFRMSQFSTSTLASWPFQSAESYSAARYLEEFHQTATQVTFDAGGNSFMFDVGVYVHYIKDNKKHHPNPTDTKEVTVSVSYGDYPAPLVRLSRTFAP